MTKDRPTLFTCTGCGGTFEATRPDEEARAEYDERFGADCPGPKPVCGDCYDRLMAAYDADRAKAN